MHTLREYDVVKVIALFEEQRHTIGSDDVTRQPAVGETPAPVVFVYDPKDPAAPVIVECVNRQGNTLWLADCLPQELELIERYPPEDPPGRGR